MGGGRESPVGTHQDLLAKCGVKRDGHVLRHLNVLLLILANGYQGAPINENIGGHQHGIGEEAHGGFQAPCHLILVAVGPLQQALAHRAGQKPRQLSDLGNVRLAEEGHPRRIQPERQILQGHIVHQGTQTVCVMDGGQAVKIGNKEEGLLWSRHRMLQLKVLGDGSKIVAKMEGSAGLNAREHPWRRFSGGIGWRRLINWMVHFRFLPSTSRTADSSLERSSRA